MDGGLQFPPLGSWIPVPEDSTAVGGYLNTHCWLPCQKKRTEYLPGQVVERGHPETGHHCPFPLLWQQFVPDRLLGPQRLFHLRRKHGDRCALGYLCGRRSSPATQISQSWKNSYFSTIVSKRYIALNYWVCRDLTFSSFSQISAFGGLLPKSSFTTG